MLAVAQPASKESAGKKPAPNPPAGAPLIQSEAPAPALQRKTCPCGGGCPKCPSPVGGAMLQTKLTVNTPGDAFELEADRVAEQVMRMPAPPDACPCGGGCPKCQAKAGASHELQMKSVDSAVLCGTAAPPIVHDVLRTPGQPLDPAARSFMEPRFGYDFSEVRVHNDAAAQSSARLIDAKAYTVGRDIVFAPNQFPPSSGEGMSLLAHELTHVVQQNAGGVRIRRQPEERGTDQIDHTIMRMPETGNVSRSVAASSLGPVVQRRCAACDQEDERVNRHASSEGAPHVSPSVSANIHALQGRGAPLPAASRAFFEPRFGADFSQVRIHTDAHAARTASSIKANAFTVGNDIAFASGQFAPHSSDGQRLLAHELTHVVQQGGARDGVLRRDEDSDAQPPAPDVDTKPTFNPDAVILKLLYLLGLAQEGAGDDLDTDPDAEVSDDEETFQSELSAATGWLGSGAIADRQILLLRSEDVRLQKDAKYRKSIVEKFASTEDPDEEYLGWLLGHYAPIAKTEEATLAQVNANLPGSTLSESNFVDNALIQEWDGGNAFPNYASNIISPLVSPSSGIRAAVPSNVHATQAALAQSWGALGWDLYANGVPASYGRSLSLTEYSTVKMRAVPKLLKMPGRPWIYDQFVMPEEVELHTDAMKSYTANLTASVLASLENSVFEKWSEATAIRWLAFDAYAISAFRREHPSGLGSVADLFDYQAQGLGRGAALEAQKIKAQIGTSGVNPFLFLARISAEVRGIAPGLLSELNASELQNFKNVLANADSEIVKLAPSLRLMTAVEWSITKGFATSRIYALLENLDEILWDILKQMAKDKAVKKAIATGIGYLGPWGRTISVIYNVLDFFDDARDKIELALLIKEFVEALDQAKESRSIVSTQQASARLAQVFESTFQRLIQKLGAKLLSKLHETAAKKLDERRKKRERMGDAERTNRLEDARSQKDAKQLKPEELEAEFQTAIESPVKVVGDAIVIELPNGHKWKRKKGAKGWCRASEDCIGDFLNPDPSADLSAYARKHLGDDFDYDGYEPVLNHPLVYQTTRGNFGEHVSDHMIKEKGYYNLGGMTHPENPDRGPGIDNLWIPRNRKYFDYTVTETKFVTGFDGEVHRVKMGKTRSGPQESDNWITGMDFNTKRLRLEEIVVPKVAEKIRESIDNNRVERLLIVVNETGKTWVYEVDSGGKVLPRLKEVWQVGS